MKCHEAKRRLDLFMDGELSVPDNMTILEHLNICKSCDAAFAGERALRDSLKARSKADKLPEEVAQRIFANLGPGPISTQRRHSRRSFWGRVAAAAAFLAVAGAALFTSSGELPSAFAAEATTRHEATREGFHPRRGGLEECLCALCHPQGADQAADAFFRRHVSHDVCLHDLRPMGYELVGVSVWEHRGQLVCWTVHRNAQGRTISHGLARTPVALGGRPVRVSEGRRPALLIPYKNTGSSCVFIFDEASAADRFAAMVMGK